MSALLKKDFCFSCHLIVSQSKDGMQDEEKYEDHFLGVMGTDVPLNYLKEFILQPLVSLMWLRLFVMTIVIFGNFAQIYRGDGSSV